jgi:LPXTG-motif cell wall-anchored protein
MSRYFGATDVELSELLDVKEKVELTPEQFDAVLYDKLQTEKAAARKKAAAEELMRNMPGSRLPPSVRAAMDKKPALGGKKDNTGLLVGVGVALVALLFYMRRKKKGPSQVTYAVSPKGMR